jgi:hypothetical protein
VENLLADLERQISSIHAELRVLATAPSLQTGDIAAFDRQMREALGIRGTSIVLYDTQTQQVLSTNLPFGAPLPRATNSEMLNRVVETEKWQISDLIIDAVLWRPIVMVGVPVFRDGRVAYVLARGSDRRSCPRCCRSKACHLIGQPRYLIAWVSRWDARAISTVSSASPPRRSF